MKKKITSLTFALALGTLSLGASGIAMAQQAITEPQVQIGTLSIRNKRQARSKQLELDGSVQRAPAAVGNLRGLSHVRVLHAASEWRSLYNLCDVSEYIFFV